MPADEYFDTKGWSVAERSRCPSRNVQTMRWLDCMGQNSIGKHGLWLIILIMEIGLNSIGIMGLWIKHGLWIKFTNVQIGSHCIIQACYGAMTPCPPLSDRAKVLAVREVPFGRFGHQRLGRARLFLAGKWGVSGCAQLFCSWQKIGVKGELMIFIDIL